MKFPSKLRGCIAAIAAVAATGLAACGDSTGPGTAQLTILLTDEPGDVIEAWVTIDQVILVPGENEEENGGGLLVLTDEDWSGDLLTLQDPGEFDTLVQDAVIPAGFYEQLRFVISGACIVVETDVVDEFDVFATPGYVAIGEDDAECDEPTGALQTPSFAETGIKVILPGGAGMELDGVESLTADFDVSESFGQLAGDSGMWVMTPVIIATETETAAE